MVAQHLVVQATGLRWLGFRFEPSSRLSVMRRDVAYARFPLSLFSGNFCLLDEGLPFRDIALEKSAELFWTAPEGDETLLLQFCNNVG